MTLIPRSVHLGLGIALAFACATASAQKATKAELPPPPGINDPGIGGAKQTPSQAEVPQANDQDAADGDPMAPIAKPDSRLIRDKPSRHLDTERMAASEVTRRKQGDDTVEEYRQSGHVWMVKIVPLDGPEQFFLANGGGKLVRDPKEGPISPVYFSLYEWQ